MEVSRHEIEQCRFHLGYGQVNIGAYPYTPDGFFELFINVIKPNIYDGGVSTVSTTDVTSGTSTVTPTSMVGIEPFTRLMIDVAGDAETITVKSVTPTSFRATFGVDHEAGVPLVGMGGISRLRSLIHQMDTLWEKTIGPAIAQTAGIEMLGNGEIKFFGGSSVLRDTVAQYKTAQQQLSSLLRVATVTDSGGSTRRGNTPLEQV